MKKTTLLFLVFVVVGIVGSLISNDPGSFGKTRAWFMVAAVLATAIILTKIFSFIINFLSEKQCPAGVERNRKKKGKRKNKLIPHENNEELFLRS